MVNYPALKLSTFKQILQGGIVRIGAPAKASWKEDKSTPG